MYRIFKSMDKWINKKGIKSYHGYLKNEHGDVYKVELTKVTNLDKGVAKLIYQNNKQDT